MNTSYLNLDTQYRSLINYYKKDANHIGHRTYLVLHGAAGASRPVRSRLGKISGRLHQTA